MNYLIIYLAGVLITVVVLTAFEEYEEGDFPLFLGLCLLWPAYLLANILLLLDKLLDGK